MLCFPIPWLIFIYSMMRLLIYKYEPLWQEVSVKSVILRWPLRPVGLLLTLVTCTCSIFLVCGLARQYNLLHNELPNMYCKGRLTLTASKLTSFEILFALWESNLSGVFCWSTFIAIYINPICCRHDCLKVLHNKKQDLLSVNPCKRMKHGLRSWSDKGMTAVTQNEHKGIRSYYI